MTIMVKRTTRSAKNGPTSSTPRSPQQEQPPPPKAKVVKATKARKIATEARPSLGGTVPVKVKPRAIRKAPAPRTKAAAESKPKAAPVRKAALRTKNQDQSMTEEKTSDQSMADQKSFDFSSINATHIVASGTKTKVVVPAAKVSPEKDIMDLSKFKFTRVINESVGSKMVTFLGTYQGEDAVIRLEKTLIDEESMKKALLDKGTRANEEFTNDVYSSYIVTPAVNSATASLSNIKATIVCPADNNVLTKYTHSDRIFFSESPDVYSKVVEPYIENKLKSNGDYNQWVYNILDGKSEADRVVLNDPDLDSGFIMVPNLNWSGDEKDLYLLAICHRRDIRSIRDLNDKHLTLLKNILTKGTKAVKDKCKNVKGQLRTFIHYHPSFYHFHVHFKMVDAGDYSSSDRDNLLNTVINNITLNKNYYKKSTLTYPLPLDSALYHELKEAGRVS